MPHIRKVYQKKTTVKEKIALMKFFFWHLCIAVLDISRLKSTIGPIAKVASGTDALFSKVSVGYICTSAHFFCLSGFIFNSPCWLKVPSYWRMSGSGVLGIRPIFCIHRCAG
jgi:hypothetical protein